MCIRDRGAIDLLLTDLAALLRAHFPQDAQLARFGDDVFAVLQTGLSPQQQRPLLEALLKKAEGHLFDINGRTAQTTLSIGVAGLNDTTPKAGEVIDRAQRCADQLDEPGTLKLFDPAQELAAAASRGSVVAMVQQALEQNSFRLLFQPVISPVSYTHLTLPTTPYV